MKIFIDVDNTIIEHYGFYENSTEARVHKAFTNHPEDNVNAIRNLYKTSICTDPKIIKELFFSDDVYILTKYNSVVYESEKKIRLGQILDVTPKELEELTDKEGNKKYIAVGQDDQKTRVVKEIFQVDSLHNYILIDDFSENLIEWEREDGVGIKYYNQYNSPTHPTNGLSISNFKIFDYYLKNRDINNLIIVGQNRYKLRELSTRFEELFKYKHIELLKVVFEDLSTKIGIKELSENSKYSHYEFIVEYYKFINHVMEDYFPQHVQNLLNHDIINIISSTFEITVAEYKNLAALTIKINSQDDSDKSIYDVYLTLNEERFIDDIQNTYEIIIKIFKQIIHI